MPDSMLDSAAEVVMEPEKETRLELPACPECELEDESDAVTKLAGALDEV